jgi:hypothetical protein
VAALLLAGEIGLFTQTVRAFGFVSQQTRRHEDVRKAKAGYEAGLLGQIADLYDDARRIKRFTRMSDLLMRSDFSGQLAGIVKASDPLRRITRAHRNVRLAGGVLCCSLIIVQLAAPAFLLNNVVGYAFLSERLDEVAAWVFAGSALFSAGVALLVWRLDIRFERVLQGGKELDV